MDITQEDLLLVLKSVKEELVQEELAAKAAAESSESSSSSSSPVAKKAEASESSSESTEDSSPVAKKAEASESCSESETKMPEKKKSEPEVAPEAPADLYETYVGLGQESLEELKNHSIAANMALLAHAGRDMSSSWEAFKSAKEEVIQKSAEQEALESFSAEVEAKNQELVEKNQVLEKSLQETNEKIAQLTAKFAELAKQPQPAQAATVKVDSTEAQVIVRNPQEIVKSLADAAKSETISDKDREIISKYTMRPKMTPELQEFLKKIGSGK